MAGHFTARHPIPASSRRIVPHLTHSLWLADCRRTLPRSHFALTLHGRNQQHEAGLRRRMRLAIQAKLAHETTCSLMNHAATARNSKDIF